jgi:replicative DNA helicase
MGNAAQLFTKDFQISLVAQLARDERLLVDTRGYLKLTDFDLPACRLVFEAIRGFHDSFGTLADIPTLELHVLRAIQNPDGKTETLLTPEEYESVGLVMAAVATAIPTTDGYFKHILPEYLRSVRLSQAMDDHAQRVALGQGADDLIGAVLQINQDVAHHSDLQLDGVFSNPEALMSHQTFRRISTGLPRLDERIGTGLGTGEQGMITACPGVGKTTTLINFMDGSMNTGSRSLFLTLELAAYRIKHRLQALSAGIDARYFKTPVPTWPEHYLKMYNDILNPEINKRFDYASIIDMSKRSHNLADVDRAIGMWKEHFVKIYGEEDARCRAVYVDWLDKLNPSGLHVGKNARDDVILMKMNETLGELARKYDVAIWTATQGTREADGQEVLKMKHTAYGYHKNDPLDVGLGIGVIFDESKVEETGDLFPRDDQVDTLGGVYIDPEKMPSCKRDLMISITKNRDNPTGSFKVYQGKTLKFYSRRSDEQIEIEYYNKKHNTQLQ